MDITIFDSTLRDGAQAEGISFSVADKLKIVEVLDELGVSFIEAGNPGSNNKELEFFKEISKVKLNNSKIVAFGSTRRANILPEEDKNLEALLEANTEYVSIFGKSNDFHVTDILHTTLDENLEMITSSISFLTKANKKVFFDAEHFFDGYKRNKEYALMTLTKASLAGAKAIVLCDTNGGTFPKEIFDIVTEVKKFISIPIGIHAHNDCGCAVANSIMAIRAGASQVQGTMTGFGERCGNTNLSTVIGNLYGHLNISCLENDNTQYLKECCGKINELSNLNLDKGMPYVGASAFAHKAGMHIDGVLKASNSFEHVNPETFGNSRRFLLSEASGKGTILNKLKKLNLDLDKNDDIVAKMVDRVKELEFSGYQFEGADASFELLTLKEMGLFKPFFKMDEFKVISDNKGTFSATAIVKLTVDDKTVITAEEGNGPVNALDKALRKALEIFFPVIKNIRLVDYKVRILNANNGTGATTRVLISSSNGSETWNTVGLSKDIIEASWIALLDSVEYKLYKSIGKKDV